MHKMRAPIFLEKIRKKSIILSSAECAKKVVKVNIT